MPTPSDAQTGRRAERRARHQEVGRSQLLEVAELAEFSVGSLYSFFEGKDELFHQIFVRRGDEFMPAMQALLTDADADPGDQLHSLVDFQVGFFRAHPHFGRLYLRDAGSLRDARVVDERYEAAFALEAALVRRGQAAGRFHPGDPEVLARLFSGLVSSFQAVDPAVQSGGADQAERLSLAELHAIVERTFVLPG